MTVGYDRDSEYDSEADTSETNDDSVSEHNSSEEEQDHEPIASFEPFDIVLVDIQKAAEERKIHCVKKQMAPGVDLKYVAISYRWGELREDMVRATDYNAHITSFDIDDFMDLCYAISQEADLCTMQYIWVDTICVDQANETRRKATIYHMNEIYECANWILAVPDLNRAYFKRFSSDNEVITWIFNNPSYIYHIIMNNKDYAINLDNQWMRDVMEVPEDLRCYLRTTKKLDSTPHALAELIEGLSLLEEEQCNNNGRIEKILKWQGEVNERYAYIERACTFLKDRISDWSNRTWVISEYSIARKKNSGIIKFWFVSLTNYIFDECYDSESEPTFRFFDTNISYKPRTADGYMSDTTQTTLLFTSDSLDIANKVVKTAKTSISRANFLVILLLSNASRNSDRFNAIMPISKKYKHYVKDQDTIKNWHITDMVSVRMRVCQWLTVLENLGLLYRFAMTPSGVMLPSFDRNDMHVIAHVVPMPCGYYELASSRLNYDLKISNPPAVIIKDKIDGIDVSALGDSPIRLRYSMYLMPKFYQYKFIRFKRDISYFISDGIWKEIGVDPSFDQLVWLRIPYYLPCDNPLSRENITEPQTYSHPEYDQINIHISTLDRNPPYNRDEIDKEAKRPGNTLDLIGSNTKNVWVVIDHLSKLLSYKYIASLDDWEWRKHDNAALHIY